MNTIKPGCARSEPSTRDAVFEGITPLQLLRQTAQYHDDGDWYLMGFWITAAITFIATWLYCIASYGFLFGVGLGWLPALIVAAIVGALWPLLALVAILLILVFFALAR